MAAKEFEESHVQIDPAQIRYLRRMSVGILAILAVGAGASTGTFISTFRKPSLEKRVETLENILSSYGKKFEATDRFMQEATKALKE